MGNADLAPGSPTPLGHADAFDTQSQGADAIPRAPRRRRTAASIASLALGNNWQTLLALTRHPGVYDELGNMIVAGLSDEEEAALSSISPDVSYIQPELGMSKPRRTYTYGRLGAFVSSVVAREEGPLPPLIARWDRASAFERHVLPGLTAQLTNYMQANELRGVGLRVEAVSLQDNIDVHVGDFEEHPEHPPLFRRVSSLRDAVQPRRTASYIAQQLVWFADSGRSFGEVILPQAISQAATDEIRWAYADLEPRCPDRATSIHPAVFVYQLPGSDAETNPRRHSAMSDQAYLLSHTFVLPRTLY